MADSINPRCPVHGVRHTRPMCDPDDVSDRPYEVGDQQDTDLDADVAASRAARQTDAVRLANAVREVHFPTADSGDHCGSEMWSLDYFRHGQVDAYWIQCTRTGAHDEHEDGGNTGARWAVTPDDPCPNRQVCDGCDEPWPCETERRILAAFDVETDRG